jgi:hypothetical protein
VAGLALVENLLAGFGITRRKGHAAGGGKDGQGRDRVFHV